MGAKTNNITTLTQRIGLEWFLLPVLYSLFCLLGLSFSFPLFHLLAEMGSVIVGLAAMATATLSHRFSSRSFILIYAIGLGWCAFLDLGHTIAYKGMNLIPAEGANLATQLWVSARLLQAFVVIGALALAAKSIRPDYVHAACLTYSTLVIFALYAGLFPTAFDPASGLTTFKIITEYVVISLLILAALLLWKRRASHSRETYWGVLGAITFMVLSEFSFTLYDSVYDSANVAGHLFKIFAYWFVFRVLILAALEEPFTQSNLLLFNLGKRVKELNTLQILNTLSARPNLTREELLTEVVRFLPEGFVDPGRACARIESPWGAFGDPEALIAKKQLERVLKLGTRPIGRLVVAYRENSDEPPPDFLEEENKLLDLVENQIEEVLDHIQAQEKISRLNFVYEMLSNTNRAIVHCDNSESLIEKVFETLSGGDNFQAAFAFVKGEDDLTMTLRHTNEIESGAANIIEKMVPDCVPNLDSASPGRTGHIVTIFGDGHDTHEECRVMLENLGYHYLVLLRLESGQSFLGVLGIFVRKPGTLGDDVVRLLEEMAGDIGYALTSLTQSKLRRDAEDKASMSEARFKMLFDLSPSPMVLINDSGEQVGLTNQAHNDFLGTHKNELLTSQQFFREFVSGPDLAQKFYTEWKSAVEESKSQNKVFVFHDVRLQSRRHSEPLIATAHMIRIQKDLLVVWTDLTAIYRNEKRLRESEERFRAMIEQASMPIWVKNEQDVLVYINHAACTTLGFSLDELLGKSEDAVVSEKGPAPSDEIGAEVLHLTTREGEVLDFRAHVTEIEWNRGRAFITFGEDITQQRRLEHERAERDRLLRELAQQVPGVIYQFQLFPDGSSCFPFASERIWEIYEVSPEEVRTDASIVFSRLHPEDRHEVERSIQESADNLTLWRDDYRVMLPEQGCRWRTGFARPERKLDGSTLWHGFIEDSTDRKEIEQRLARYTKELKLSMRGTLEVVSRMIDIRDPYTAGHERRVARIAKKIGESMGMEAERVELLELTGIVHDIGKISVPADILTKPARLSDLEMKLVRTHAQTGYDILKEVPLPDVIATAILQHHERLDGSGYPNGLKGNEITLEARILAVADVLESMASHRPYRPALGVEAAIDELRRNSGSLYDPEVVETVIRLIEEKQIEVELL